MKTCIRLVIVTALAVLATPLLTLAASDPVAKNKHGPELVAQQSPDAAATSSAAPATEAQMSAQIHRMQIFHQSMMQAKTPEARSRLMPEQLKIMQESMAMMQTQDPKGMAGCKHGHGRMKARMEMMSMMIQLMQDQQTTKNP